VEEKERNNEQRNWQKGEITGEILGILPSTRLQEQKLQLEIGVEYSCHKTTLRTKKTMKTIVLVIPTLGCPRNTDYQI
jgi:hypothetical protein